MPLLPPCQPTTLPPHHATLLPCHSATSLVILLLSPILPDNHMAPGTCSGLL